MAWIRERPLLQTYLGVTLVMVFIGGGVTYTLRLPIESSVREDAVRDVVVTTPHRILTILRPQDMAQPMSERRYEEVDRMVRDYALGPDTVRLKLWNPSGTVVYSTLPSQIGDSDLENENLHEALQGRVVWEVGYETEAPQERSLGELMEVYVPLAWEPEGRPAGVLEVYLDYAPYSSHLAAIRNAIFLAAGMVGLVVSISLYLLYRTGYRAIQQQRDTALQREREAAALNRLLQRAFARMFEVRDRLTHLRDEIGRQQGGEAPSARDAYIRMQVKETADFAEGLLATSEGLFATSDEKRPGQRA